MRVEIGLLGGFAVTLDGVAVPAACWNRRPAAALVKLLALAPRARLHRDRVVDALWPDATLDAALPRLHKAAHFARQTLGSRDAVVLKDGVVALFPGTALHVDVRAFESAADAALVSPATSAEACTAAITLYRGELLPDDLGESWLAETRDRLRTRLAALLRHAGRWDELLRIEPADEQAHVELLREAVLAGDRAAALRRYDQMERILHTELGVAPSPEAVALRERVLVAHAAPARTVRERPPVSETLLERDAETAALVRAFRSVARTQRGAVVLVTGEAGSGKSSLVRAFLDRIEDDVVVAVGGCDDLLAPRSLAPFRDMAETLPGLASALSAPPDDVFPALLRILAAAPTVVVIEDVHWADDVTLDAIRYLARRIPGIPAILLLTYREEDVDAAHPLRRILGNLDSASHRRLMLPPLTAAAVGRLAGVDPDEAAEIHRVTRGNPFFVTEVIAAGGQSVPATVRDAVLARVGRLPAAARRLAERIAVVPSRTERWLAESLVAGDPGALVEAERSGVLTGGPEYVAFRHELARRAVETSLTGAEVVQANRQVLDVLLRQPQVDPARIVHHAARASRVDLLLEYGPVAAADAERTGAYRQAAETLRAVLEHAALLDHPTRARLLTRRAYALYLVNEYEAALPCARSAVALAEDSPDPAVLADALMVLSRTVLFARGPMPARDAAGRAVRILESTRPVDERRLAEALIELARTHSNLPTVGIVAQPSEQAVRYAERALRHCDRLGRDDLRAQALCYLGTGRLALGDPRGADDLARAVLLGNTEPRLETRVRAYVNASGGTYRAGRLDDAERYVAAGLRLAADAEFAAGQYRLRLTSAAVAASAGHWDRAVGLLRLLLTDPGQPGVMALLARSLLARLLARRGDPEAGTILEEAWQDPVAAGDSYVAGPLAVAQVELDWLTGTTGSVPNVVRRALESADRSEHTAMAAELCGYLRRAGHNVPAPLDPPGPWALALAGQSRAAAAAWNELGERYEYGVELAWSGEDPQVRAAGVGILRQLGATATVARALARPDRP